MPVGVSAYRPLATVTLGSSASSVTFSSIPATYRDLVLVIQAGSTSSTTALGVRLNNDTTGDKQNVFMGGNGSTAASYTDNNVAYLNVGDLYTTDRNSVSVVQIMDYSATDKHKTALTRFSRGATNVLAIASRQPTTAAITSVIVIAVGQNLASGSRCDLYGIAS